MQVTAELPIVRAPGATRQDWANLIVAGLTADLLPVVSDITVPKSERSKVDDIRKVPSKISNGFAHGIADWTQKQSSAANVEHWMNEPRYGICIQTRNVRAIDIDVADPVLAQQIEAFFDKQLGAIPVRYRNNSGKRLLAVRIEGKLHKMIYRLAGGALLEFLGQGQQFIAAGTHTSGVRYEWRTSDGEVLDGPPLEFPSVSQERFEAAWKTFPLFFETVSASSASERRRGESVEVYDDVARYLEEEGLVLDQGREGQLFVECPWKDGHSMDSGVTEAAWFQAGSGGYERGHFKCLHASCAHRTDEEFLDAIEYRISAFEVIETPPAREGETLAPLPYPPLVRDGQGRAEANLHNLDLALRRPDMCGLELGFDAAIHDQVAREDCSQPWRPLTDNDMTAMRLRLERKAFKPIGRELMRDVVALVCEAQSFDSYADWLRGLEWDGVPRVEGFLARYFGVEPGAYVSAVSRYWWTAAAGRVLSPGIQADMVPVLVGDQGLGKTQGIKALLPTPDAYVEVHLGDKEDNLARLIRGAMIGELAELRGLRTREAEAIKAWITRQRENWTPKFKERNTSFARRCIFVGTTNEEQFLDDPTGERRWLPVTVGKVDVPALLHDRDQLWAEARLLFEAGGITWREAQALAGEQHATFKVVDERQARLSRWLRDPHQMHEQRPIDREYLLLVDVAQEAFGLDAGRLSRADQMAIGKMLNAEGYKVRVKRVENRPQRVWVRDVTSCYDLV